MAKPKRPKDLRGISPRLANSSRDRSSVAMDPAVSNDETHVASANTEMLSGAKIESDDGQATVIDQDDEQIIEAIGEFYDSARSDEEGKGAPPNLLGGHFFDNHEEDTDSSEDERPSRNTIGDVPLKWYKHEDHIGYDREGEKISKKVSNRDRLDDHLAKQDGGRAWRTIYDEYNDEEILLSKEEIRMIQRIRSGSFPHVEVDPFPEYNDFFSRDVDIHPVLNIPEPKRRFVRSKWEEKKVVKLVRAIRKGWLKLQTQSAADDEAPLYLMWEEDNQVAEKTAVGLSYIPPPKSQLPGHEQSYNPPQEYLPNEEEKRIWSEMDEEDRVKILPRQFDALRKVPMYQDYIKERFERCLDLYLCPRSRKKRINIDPETLVPQLPKPADLQPFPTTMCLEYTGHTAKVTTLSPDTSGQWIASGSADGTVRIWEVSSGRCTVLWKFEGAIACVAWCPRSSSNIIAAAVGKSLYLLPSGTGSAGKTIEELRQALSNQESKNEPVSVQWRLFRDGMELVHKFPLRTVTWHMHGDYFASVSPDGNTQAVMVHQLTKLTSQNPFRKNRGRVQQVLFHPTKPFFFVASSNNVRVYNLAKQCLAKKLTGGSGVITSIALHRGGDNIIVGCEDSRLLWFDMDLSTKPYRSLKYHSRAVRSVAFHSSYPSFATSSDDGTVQVFHGMVYTDLMSNPLIVPVKILRGHQVIDFQGVLDVKYHPTQPWLFTAGADNKIKLWCN